MDSIKKILWPTDASESSLQALSVAVVLGRKFASVINVLQVIEQVPRMAQAGFANAPLDNFDYPYFEKQLAEVARENLEKTVAEHIPKAMRGDVRVEIGRPKEAIVDFAREQGVDLIVMATHGRTGLSHLMLGSVAEATLRQSSVPVLVVPARETAKED